MNGFFDRFEEQLVAAGRRRESRRLRVPRRAGRLALAAALLVPAGALAGRDLLDGAEAPAPDPPDPAMRTPAGHDRVGPVSKPVFIAHGTAPNGHPWRISAYSCGDKRYDHVILGLSTSSRDPSRPCHFIRRGRPPVEVAPHETYNSAIKTTVVYGVTSERVRAVDMRRSSRTIRVPTRAVPAALAERAGLPRDFRFFVKQFAGDGGVKRYTPVYEPR